MKKRKRYSVGAPVRIIVDNPDIVVRAVISGVSNVNGSVVYTVEYKGKKYTRFDHAVEPDHPHKEIEILMNM